MNIRIIMTFIILFIPLVSLNANADYSLNCHKTFLVPVTTPPIPNPTARCNMTWTFTDAQDWPFGFMESAGIVPPPGVEILITPWYFLTQDIPLQSATQYLMWTVPGSYLVDSKGLLFDAFYGGENGQLEIVEHPQGMEEFPSTIIVLP